MAPAVLERDPISALEHERGALVRAESLLDHLGKPEQTERPKLVGPGGEEVELPEPLFRVLRLAVHHLLQGNSVAIAPIHKELTTQQAADLLNVSRPYLVQLLEAGRMPFMRTGAHRRVRLGDVLAYKQQRDVERREGMKRLAEISQELGLYEE